jgi:hypothetical protein
LSIVFENFQRGSIEFRYIAGMYHSAIADVTGHFTALQLAAGKADRQPVYFDLKEKTVVNVPIGRRGAMLLR